MRSTEYLQEEIARFYTRTYMFDELTKYRHEGHFLLRPHDNLREVCNAPNNYSGVYLVYALKQGKIDLIYVGRSGKHNADGSMFIRKAGLGGLKDRIVNGHQFGKIPRRISWLNQMAKKKIEALDIYWYVTHNDSYSDCPRVVENKLLQIHVDTFGRLPRWNNEL